MKASAPASSANLGPGFDCLALALDIRCMVEAVPGDEWGVSTGDPDGFLVTAAASLSDEPLVISVASEIPAGRGLGSSSAVLAALATAVRRLQGKPDDADAVFEFVAAIDGHADNAAAAVHGGLVHAGDEGWHHLEIHPSLRAVVAVPDVTLPTRQARAALPGDISLEVAGRTISRAVRLVEGLRTGDVELLRSVGPDELHEPYRIALRPVMGELMAAARLVGAPFVAVSGAGPSVLALTTEAHVGEVKAAFGKVGSAVLTPDLSSAGVI